MARISMECRCGWKFFLPESTQGWRAACPNCGSAVSIPGRKPGQKVFETAGQLAAEKERGWAMARLAIGLGAAGVLAVIGLIVYLSVPDSQEAPTEPRRSARAEVAPPPPPPPPPSSGPSVPPPPPAGNPSDPSFLRHQVRQATWMVNIAMLVAETLRFRGMMDERDRMIGRAADWEMKLRGAVARVEETGERAQVEDYVRPTDVVVGFARKDLSTMTRAQAADLLAAWLAIFRANHMEQVVVARGDRRVTVYVDIPEVSVELLELARTPTGEYGRGDAAVAAPSPGPAPGPAAPVAPGAGDLIKQVEAAFAGLPPGYRRLLYAADRARLDSILQRRAPSLEEAEFLRNSILGAAIPAFDRDATLVATRKADFEAKLKSTTAVDVIHFKDGRKVEGQFVSETETHLKFKARLGTITVPREEVLRVDRGKGAGLEFPDKLKAAEGRLDPLISLLLWCRDKGLKLEGDYVACLVLALDASHTTARGQLSLRDPLAEPAARPSPPTTTTTTTAPVAPRPAPSDAALAKTELTAERMDLEAAEVVRRYSALNDVIAQMRTRSGTLPFGVPPPCPPASARAMNLIVNPLTYRPTALSADAAQELATWWAALPVPERRAFARFIGLWCCHLRFIAGR